MEDFYVSRYGDAAFAALRSRALPIGKFDPATLEMLKQLARALGVE
jgi:hypothetical protein